MEPILNKQKYIFLNFYSDIILRVYRSKQVKVDEGCCDANQTEQHKRCDEVAGHVTLGKLANASPCVLEDSLAKERILSQGDNIVRDVIT